MGFQILDENNQPLSIKELDRQAAEFWGKEVHPKEYANPSEPKKEDENQIDFLKRSMLGNWFDVIGHQIHSPSNYTTGWKNIIYSLLVIQIPSAFLKDDLTIPEFVKTNEDDKHIHLPEDVEISIYCSLKYLKPYIALIKHWDSKGYQPKQIKE